jgi:cytochrome b subunit of formate dehydrogenase
MMSTFIILAITGLPQRFSEMGLSQWWVGTLGGLETVRNIHRTAGIIMLADCVFHVGYLIHRIGVQRQTGPLRMIPNRQDALDVLQTIRYFLGTAHDKPRFDRFSYLEKFDYWAVFWGIAMIGVSGLILMYPVLAAELLPGQAIPTALTIHGDEALLAVGWILIMHMFNVHLAPWVFPFNPSIFTGKVKARRYAEEHPAEWDRLMAEERARSVATPRTDRPAQLAPRATTKDPSSSPSTARRPSASRRGAHDDQRAAGPAAARSDGVQGQANKGASS